VFEAQHEEIEKWESNFRFPGYIKVSETENSILVFSILFLQNHSSMDILW